MTFGKQTADGAASKMWRGYCMERSHLGICARALYTHVLEHRGVPVVGLKLGAEDGGDEMVTRE